MREARREYYTYFTEESCSNQGKLFRATEKLLSDKIDELMFPGYAGESVLANDIGKLHMCTGRKTLCLAQCLATQC